MIAIGLETKKLKKQQFKKSFLNIYNYIKHTIPTYRTQTANVIFLTFKF